MSSTPSYSDEYRLSKQNKSPHLEERRHSPVGVSIQANTDARLKMPEIGVSLSDDLTLGSVRGSVRLDATPVF